MGMEWLLYSFIFCVGFVRLCFGQDKHKWHREWNPMKRKRNQICSVGRKTHAVLHCCCCPEHFIMMLWSSICCNTFWHPQPYVTASYWPECLQWSYLVCQQMQVHIMDCSGHVHLCHSRYISKVGWCFYDSSMRYLKAFSKTFQHH